MKFEHHQHCGSEEEDFFRFFKKSRWPPINGVYYDLDEFHNVNRLDTVIPPYKIRKYYVVRLRRDRPFNFW